MEQQGQQPTNQGNSNQQPASGKAKNGGKKKDSPTRAKAKSMFDSSAAPVSADKFFSDYTEIRRNNVDVTYDPTLVDRLSVGYVKQADDYANYIGQTLPNRDLQIEAHSLVNLTVTRKLMLSTPQSEVQDVAPIKDIMNHDLFVPKNLAAVVANVGKFELDDYIARIKYSTQDLFRNLLEMCKLFDGHSNFNGLYLSPVWTLDDEGMPIANVPWADIHPEQIVLPVESSTRWIRDQAKGFLDQAYEHTWEVTDAEGNQYQVTYPHLAISNDIDRQLRNVVAWLGRLHPAMPQVERIAAAGLCTAWKTFWTSQYNTILQDLIPGIPDVDFLQVTPEQILLVFNINIWAPSRVLERAGNDPISMIRNIHSFIKERQPVFARYLDLVQMPNDKFGSEAQMVPLKVDDFVERPMIGLHRNYFQPRFESHSNVIAKFKNKGRVVVGLAAGLTNNVEIRNNFQARLNGNAATILGSILSPDYKRMF